ncbi:MAG: DUF885 family protein [Pseudomonadales bacterium]
MKVIYLFTIALLVASCGGEQSKELETSEQADAAELSNSADGVTSTQFDELLDQYYEDYLKLNPLQATFEGDARYNDQFINALDPAVEKRVTETLGKYLSALSDIDDSSLSDSQRMSKDVLAWELGINLDGLAFDDDLTPIDQMWSVNLMIGQLASGASAQPFNTVADYSMWLTRVDAYLEWLDATEGKMREGVEKGWVMPKALIKKVLPQLAGMASDDVQEHLFFSPAKNFPDEFSEEDKERLTEQYTAMVKTKVAPAYKKIHDYMAGDYLEAGRDSSGIDALPGGEDFYKHQIKKYTTTNMTADEIHQLGLSEVARIQSEMESVKKQVGFEGDLKAFFDHVRNNEDLMPYKEPQQVLDHFNAIHHRMKPQVARLFDVKPKTAFEVRRTEAFRENSAAAEYNSGSLDGTRPGIFYTPIPDASRYNIFDSESLFLHEAIPGHHYQISLTQENDSLPKFRKTLWYSGYGEGWALYTESLGKELGLFTDPYQYFGMLSAEIHRAIRLVVDTGLHSKGWTREQAIDYSLANEAEPEDGIIREIERYMANPGQALAYKIGQLKIRELRSMAEKELGDKFDIAKFHNQVLETGSVPLAILEAKIQNWISASK